MKIWICFCILGIVPSVVYAILCHSSENDIEDTINISQLDTWKRSLNSSRQGEEQSTCRVQLMMIYSLSEIGIIFTNKLQHAERIDGVVVLTTSLVILQGMETITGALLYSCSTHDYCEIDFLVNEVQWFIDGEYHASFVQNSRSLLVGDYSEIGMSNQFTSYC